MKAERSRMIPRKRKENLVLSTGCSQNALPFQHHEENVPLLRQQSQKRVLLLAAIQPGMLR